MSLSKLSMRRLRSSLKFQALFIEQLKSFEKVLVLSTSVANNAPVLTDVDGGAEVVNFTFGDNTEVYGSCSVQESLISGNFSLWNSWKSQKVSKQVLCLRWSRPSSSNKSGFKLPAQPSCRLGVYLLLWWVRDNNIVNFTLFWWKKRCSKSRRVQKLPTFVWSHSLWVGPHPYDRVRA